MNQNVFNLRTEAINFHDCPIYRILPFFSAFNNRLNFIQSVSIFHFQASLYVVPICNNNDPVDLFIVTKSPNAFQQDGLSSDFQILFWNTAAHPFSSTGSSDNYRCFFLIIHFLYFV